MAVKKENNKGVSKKIVEIILKEKGSEYKDWLAEKHLEIFNENQEILEEKFKKQMNMISYKIKIKHIF